MQLQPITAALPVEVLEDPAFLQPGAEIVARVAAAASPGDGQGLLSLAGFLVPVRLPPEIETGTRLPLLVEERDAATVVLRIRKAPESPPPAPAFTGALAGSGDADLLRAALALVPQGAFLLPDGRAASVAVGEEDGGDGRRAFSARVVVDSAALGPVEIRLRLESGLASAHVVVEPRAEAVARAAAPQLAEAVARATSAACTVSLAARPPQAARPTFSLDFDAYA